MSNQFSYELDERQIKLMLSDVELESSDSAWQRFESSAFCESKSMFSNIALPKINFSISRSFIIPIIFVSLIGGLSILLFSFVDFKKSEEVLKEKMLVPNANNVSIKPQKAIAKIAKPIATPIKNQPATVIESNTPAKVEPKITSVIIDPVALAKKSVENATEQKTTNLTTAKTQSPAPIKKKKRRKETYEELPIITSQTISEATTEHELELK